LEKHFKSIIKSLKQIIENTAGEESQPIKKEANVAKNRNTKKRKPEENEKDYDEYDNDDDSGNFWLNNSWLLLTSSSKKKQYIQESRRIHPIMPHLNHKLSYERSHVPSTEDIYETPNESLETLVKQSLQT